MQIWTIYLDACVRKVDVSSNSSIFNHLYFSDIYKHSRIEKTRPSMSETLFMTLKFKNSIIIKNYEVINFTDNKL